MQLLTRVVVGSLLAWQAIVSMVAAVERVAACRDIGWDLRLGADTATRLRRVLGEDVEICATLRQLVPGGTTVWNRQVQGSLEELRRSTSSEQELVAAFERLAAQNGLFVQLAVLLYPEPFFVSVPDPIPVAESEAAAGRPAWLFVLAGDPEPAGRVGWHCVHRAARFQVWRCQKDS